MARYTGPQCKLCRREGMKLYLKGERCFTDKCAFDRRPFAPGDHGREKKKLTQYGIQLRAKQTMKRIYGVLEAQFRRYYEKAAKKSGDTRENLVVQVERRLDNVVYRLGFAVNRTTARQLVSHGHFLVNGKKVNIPSYQVRPGDVIEVREKSKDILPIKNAIELNKDKNRMPWLSVDFENYKGVYERHPKLEEVIDLPVDVQAIIELYSR
ncbi:30S ribosomal protein S4 [Thermosipho melanesiensis]|uniref:Small ribosomal subunit protein uS4 n=2 Tax=Thermosipho melanesiensis TaxID=46541 RepID=RS4_THEM4|nr:30S ribosomal protein S4 [Thermosipho melanesiensis]A6LLP0.1 RecName: Full=Small ribosomal subunit protein uS4; AltName: Full=30S ribosomal protein S4 [Thermosipho melanesiensis BI429]ABR30841.1 RNA-binding S4 domain protein [Thermosipho melanesiensis BI429]APT73961.1 30S ribosomal protein S4 [Thermosipho melanesiensis]OOC35896.1 30S ribosomal protein S4 [Thermosipho melanesiensis]OOC38398.1 30S ribosomal protein S4 [Thermosipho melanesiensis]OOC38859.1 30S ribosomal protein S4 [Thermosiph